MEPNNKVIASLLCLLACTLLIAGSSWAVTISDRSGGAIYWGGKYVNIKPSGYSDAIGRRSKVDQMEVIMNNDIVTIKITGPYFFNYVHHLKRTQDAPPGDLYISSQGWKVSGAPPYNKDIFEASEGWDYVVSFENKKVYKLKFSDITMTSALPNVSKYRAHQAWRGGYGEAVDDAEVILTDKNLTFTFSVRNMVLRSEIGVHWTMKCGNDIVEGSASIPPIAMTAPSADPASLEVVNADPIDVFTAEDALPAQPPIAAAASVSQGALIAGTAPGAAGSWGFAAAPVFAAFPVFYSGSGGTSGTPFPVFYSGSDGTPRGPGDNPTGPAPTPHTEPDASVPEPSTAFLLLAGLFAIPARKRLIK